MLRAPRYAQKDEDVEFQTGPLSVLTQSVKANTQASASLAGKGTPPAAWRTASHVVWTRHTREHAPLRRLRHSAARREPHARL